MALSAAGISSTPRGFLKCPIPVRVCAEQADPKMLASHENVGGFTKCWRPQGPLYNTYYIYIHIITHII
ncbi:MAG: hypothetical protein ACK55Z_14745, partial [bacterium]